MTKSIALFEILKQNRLIGLLTPKNAEQCVIAYETLNPLGVVLEIAFRSKAAADGIRAVLNSHPDALILAGTVMTETQVKLAIDTGVAGIVSADYISAVVEIAVRSDVMCIPGGLADCGKQLVQKAQLYGCDLDELRERYPYQYIYKLFPALTETGSNMGLAKAWKGPYKGINIVYTGGISLENLQNIVQMDPEGIYCGSAVTKAIDQPDLMRAEAQKWLNIIKRV